MARIKSITVDPLFPVYGRSISGLPQSARLVVLMGPNGSGKTSVFRALRLYAHGANDHEAFRAVPKPAGAVKIDCYDLDPRQKLPLYIRTAYRTEHKGEPTAMEALYIPNVRIKAPNASAPDAQLGRNIILLAKAARKLAFDTSCNIAVAVEAVLARVSRATKELLPHLALDMERITDFVAERADTKEPLSFVRLDTTSSVPFDYSFLSAGEKEIFDLILDLELWTQESRCGLLY